MNQTVIGNYIARKRRTLNLTQEQLAEQLGVSNKTISKWENGKCMPDYSVIQRLCGALRVTLPELMDGADAAGDSDRSGDTEQILDLLRRTQELEEAYSQLEDLNREMRAQRHDFMNHIQVVYSLIEMNEPGEAMTYMDKLYGDMQRVSRMMRTACPAVNALIQAKVVEARQRGAELKLSIAAKWDDPLMPAWEICRVLANLIDNALDAATSAQLPEGEKPTVELVLGEDLRSWFFSVRNNGPAIPEKQRAKIFEPGFTTKRTGQGMGLFIVNQTVTELGGRITVDSRDGDTVFSGFVPRKRLKLGDGETAQSDENTDIYEENAKKDDNSINKSDANS